MSHILLIEDDRWLAESYVAVLGDHNVTVVADGQSALDHVEQMPTDLIIADIMIEGGTSIDILHDLQSYPDSARIPVILCSAIARQLRQADMAAYGVVSILDKMSLRPDMLKQTVQRALREVIARG